MKFFYKPFFFFLPIGLIASILTFPCLTYAQATDQRVINLLEKKCDAKEFIYCVELASRYLKGDFVRKDVTKSVELYQKACDGGLAGSCAILGMFYEDGTNGVIENKSKAIQFYQKACDGGDGNSCSNLGEMYEEGSGVRKNSSKALLAYEKACRFKYEEGCIKYKNLKKNNPQSAQSLDSCKKVGEARFNSAVAERCSGTWNIYASIPNGGVWYSDKMGKDPVAKQINNQAKKVEERLRGCGLVVHISLSNWFDSFTSNLVVVHSSPHPSAVEAAEELKRMKQCGIDGYSKKSEYRVVGRD